ncbi:MAG TPA: NusG domain II-containing protein [Firmicutes bacterium]|nr:NusG domain II-containing protein [Candidatus Fermentithermobacillaceae bacterium]
MKKGDVLIVAVALGFSILAWAGFRFLSPSAERLEAVVQVDGKEVLRVRIDGPDLEQKDVEILNGTATVEFGQGKIRILPLPSSVCPNGICWKTGYISRPGQSIVCVPNHTTITVEGAENEVDSVIR